MNNLIKAINELKKEKNAIILGHYYQKGEIQDIADYVGDSLALAQLAAKTEADIIVMCGVHFMGETAKVLCPDKKVLVPDMEAGCSLADSCPADQFAQFVKEHPGHTVISYVNTTAAVKAVTDVVVTSTNARQIVESFPKDEKIIFGPDRNLGNYINSVTNRNMLLWDGACHVHEQFSVEKIVELKTQHPEALVLTHPECTEDVIELSDFVGSTSEIIDYATKSDADRFIICTEMGVFFELQQKNPEKKFYSVGHRQFCPNMKKVTLERVEEALEKMQPYVEVPQDVLEAAAKPLKRMLELAAK